MESVEETTALAVSFVTNGLVSKTQTEHYLVRTLSCSIIQADFKRLNMTILPWELE